MQIDLLTLAGLMIVATVAGMGFGSAFVAWVLFRIARYQSAKDKAKAAEEKRPVPPMVR